MVLDLYLRDPYVKLYTRREKITVISFVGNVGGLLGLFLGFSVISVVEVFYMWLFAPAPAVSPEATTVNRASTKMKKMTLTRMASILK